jgi:hypothetical protein
VSSNITDELQKYFNLPAGRSTIHDPNSIYVGEKLTIPYHAPSSTASYPARHAKPQPTVLTSSAKKLSGIAAAANPR